MRVHQLMSRPAVTCRMTSDLAAVAMMMWRHDCGVIPVVDDAERLVGLVTDRDICMAVATRHHRPEELTAADVIRKQVFTVEPHQDVREAMHIMAREQVRRLPVLLEDRRLAGMLSVNDLILNIRSRARSGTEPTTGDVLEMLQAICLHPQSVALVEKPIPLQPQA